MIKKIMNLRKMTTVKILNKWKEIIKKISQKITPKKKIMMLLAMEGRVLPKKLSSKLKKQLN